MNKEKVGANQMTPKNSSQMTRSDFIGRNFQSNHANLSGFLKKEEKVEEKNFLDNLNNYLANLNESVDHVSQVGGCGN